MSSSPSPPSTRDLTSCAMRRAILAVLTGVLVAVVAFGAAAPAGVLVKLNEVQVIGTHNSYHIEPPADLLEMLINIDPAAKELAYSHPPLGDQFSYEGVRQIELDVYADPAGTLWRPIGRSGFKVFHIEGFDERSTCEVFVDCLAEVKAWSDARPAHMPIAILIEVKDNADLPGPPDPIPVGPAELDALDAEIRSVFAADRLIEPDDVRGARPTLEEAVLAGEWPAIDDVRGDVIFLLDNKRDEYRSGHPSLEGRVAFTPSSPGQPAPRPPRSRVSSPPATSCAPGPTRRSSPPKPVTRPSGTPPWPAARSGSAPTTRSPGTPSDGARTTWLRSRAATPLGATR